MADCHWITLESPIIATVRSPSRSPHSQTIGSGSVWFCEQPASEDAGLSLVAWVAWGVNQSIEAREATDPGGASALADPPWCNAAAPWACCSCSGSAPTCGTTNISTSPAATPTREKFAPNDNANRFDLATGLANRNGFSTNL